jgi:cyclopropane-fatty-acyl-phospholipid synthase
MMSFIGQIQRSITNALAQWLLLKGIKQMKAGKLRIEFPNGSTQAIDSGNPGPEGILQVKDKAFFKSVLLGGEIGFGEAYQAGLCDSPDMVGLLTLAFANRRSVDLNKGIGKLLSRRKNLRLHRKQANTVDGSKENIHAHYDLGNDLFTLFLDETMTYSSAVFDSPEQPLVDAQRNKYERICQLAGITADDQVLEIGTGWGGMAIYTAGTYGCHVTTITISNEQSALAKERVEAAGLSDLIDIQLIDYRDVTGEYDKIVSIEMFEAVGVEFFPVFFEKCASLLKPAGRLAMQVITVPDSAFEAQKNGINWIQKYIFPGGVLPSVAEMERVNAKTGLVLDSTHDIGLDYATTLHQWRDRFWDQIDSVRAQGYDEYFIRTWDYYLLACEAGFLTRTTGDVHVAFDKLP